MIPAIHRRLLVQEAGAKLHVACGFLTEESAGVAVGFTSSKELLLVQACCCASTSLRFREDENHHGHEKKDRGAPSNLCRHKTVYPFAVFTYGDEATCSVACKYRGAVPKL